MLRRGKEFRSVSICLIPTYRPTESPGKMPTQKVSTETVNCRLSVRDGIIRARQIAGTSKRYKRP